MTCMWQNILNLDLNVILFLLLVCLALKFTDIVEYAEMVHTEVLW